MTNTLKFATSKLRYKKIRLTRGLSTIINCNDYEWLNQWKWHYGSQGYAVRTQWLGRIKGKRKYKKILMHREIMNTPYDMETDHINRNRLDNRRVNLRICNRSENTKNAKARQGSSPYKGVDYHKKTSKWRARISANKITIHLGLFDSANAAAKAYNNCVKKLHGKFSYFNYIRKS